jgi:hypothetical protein
MPAWQRIYFNNLTVQNKTPPIARAPLFEGEKFPLQLR